MLQTKKASYKVDFLFFVIAVFLATALSGYGQLTNYISAGLLLIIIPNSINIIPSKMTSSFLALFFFIIFYICTSIPNYSSLYYLIGTCIMYTLVTFGPFFIKIYIERKNNAALKKKLFVWLTFVWFVIVIVSIITYSASEEGGRDFANEHRGLFIGGGYSAAYASAMVSVICFYYLISCRESISKKIKLLLVAGVILSGIHVFYTMSTITIVAMLLGCVLSIFFRGKKTNKLKFGIILFTVLLAFVSLSFLLESESIGLWMMKTGSRIENDLLSERLSEVGRLLYANDESHHMGNRLYTLKVSWQTFISHPIIGVGYKYGNTYDLLYKNGVGVHSEFLDSFAKYGIVGSIPYLYFFYLQVKGLIEKSRYRITMPIVATFLIMFIFNPFLSVQTIFILCLYLPLLIELIEKQSEIGTV